jgi:DNA-binding response OmpR family regulator
MIIEDSLKDTRIASKVARLAGFEDVEIFTSLEGAMRRIEQGLKGERPLPDAIIVDLVLGHDSGFEVLRHWRTTWSDSSMRMIVWSVLGEHSRELCALSMLLCPSGRVRKRCAKLLQGLPTQTCRRREPL